MRGEEDRILHVPNLDVNDGWRGCGRQSGEEDMIRCECRDGGCFGGKVGELEWSR